MIKLSGVSAFFPVLLGGVTWNIPLPYFKSEYFKWADFVSLFLFSSGAVFGRGDSLGEFRDDTGWDTGVLVPIETPEQNKMIPFIEENIKNRIAYLTILA